jgi:peptidoglycan/xylan/chitin deacetylase (PgdA/CDA1 family)/endo-1,4-beta-D-glucanase Y
MTSSPGNEQHDVVDQTAVSQKSRRSLRRWSLVGLAVSAAACSTLARSGGGDSKEIGSVSQAAVPANHHYIGLPGEDVNLFPVANKYIGLTFDDGPDDASVNCIGTGKSCTDVILDKLKAANVKATFFFCSKNPGINDIANSAGQRATLARIVNEGHQLGSHSQQHPHFGSPTTATCPNPGVNGSVAPGADGLCIPSTDTATLDNQLTQNQLIVNRQDVLGLAFPKLTLFRLPYGEPGWDRSTTDYTNVATELKKYAVEVGWSMDSYDWGCTAEYGFSTQATRRQCVIDNFKGIGNMSSLGPDYPQMGLAQGQLGMILMHMIQPQTADALDSVISYAQGQGYTFKLAEDFVKQKYGKYSNELVYGAPAAPSGAEQKPFPQAGQGGSALNGDFAGCATCIKPNVAQATMDNDVKTFYNGWKTALLKTFTTGALSGKYYLAGGFQGDVYGWPGTVNPISTSEAHGYAMIITALMAGAGGDPNGKTIFDSLNYVRKALPSNSDSRLMSWVLPDNGSVTMTAQGPATDGTADMAYALLLAYNQWNDVTYLNEAKQIIAGMEAQFITTGSGSFYPRLNIGDPLHTAQATGAECHSGTYNTSGTTLVNCSNSSQGGLPGLSRPSDVFNYAMRAYYEAGGSSVWAQLETGSMNALNQIDGSSGLVPDFFAGTTPVPSQTGSGDEDVCYNCFSYNACRVPFRQAVSLAHYGVSASSTMTNAMVTWARNKYANQPANMLVDFTLSGSSIQTFGDPAFTSPMIAAGISNSSHQTWLNNGWTYMKAAPKNDYYGSSLTLMSMLAVSGDWWKPVFAGKAPTPPDNLPYGGTTPSIPSRIQAENYDQGGEGVAYHDTTSGNSGNTFRTDDVDIQATTDAGGGYNIGWAAAGEWLEYSVNVGSTGTYDLDLRVATTASGKTVRVLVDGVDKTGTMAVPVTASYQTYATITKTGISLNSGTRIVRFVFDTGSVNLNWIEFRNGGGGNDPSGSLASLSGTYRLRAVHSQKCIDISGASTADGAAAIQYTCGTGDNQKWAITNCGSGVHVLKAVHSNRLMDVAGASMSDGALVQQHGTDDCSTATTDEKFKVYSKGSGQYQFQAVHSGKCVDVQGGVTATGNSVPIDQATCTENNNQRFTLDNDFTAPTVPTGLAQTTVSSTSAKITWSASTDAVGVTGYNVYRDGVKIGSATSSTYTDNGLAASTTYNYKVDAYDGAGNTSAQSSQISVTTLAPTTGVDVGAVGAAGSWSQTIGTYTVNGAGADIYGTADEFQFVYQDLTGDGTIVARVVSLTDLSPTTSWSKAGVMMRDGTATGAMNVFAGISPLATNGFRRQIRATTNGSSTSCGTRSADLCPGTSVLAANSGYVKIVRTGNTFVSSFSTDGNTWTQMGSDTITMASTIKVGLAVTSHVDATLATGVFDHFVVTPGTTCTPTTCAAQGKNCGSISDGCGATILCGTCTSPDTCGGGGVTNVCGTTCTPTTCAAAGATCGSISDGCGTTLNCGSCTSPDTCGGGGVANQCGTASCTPTTCSAQGKNCGSISDGCGGTLNCGSCTSPQTCGGGGTSNVCGCTATTCSAQGKNCGSISDGCGGNLNCGTCTSPQACGGGGTANVCAAKVSGFTVYDTGSTTTATPPAGFTSPYTNASYWALLGNLQTQTSSAGTDFCDWNGGQAWIASIDSGVSNLVGQAWIRTATQSKIWNGTSPAAEARITLASTANVYLIIDDRAVAASAVETGWTDTTYNFTINDGASHTFPFSVFKKANVAAGTLDLPIQNYSGAFNYFVVVE